jgi:hypothetical protein
LPTAPRSLRATNTVLLSRASQPITGQRPTSSFDTNAAPVAPAMAMMSSQDRWLETKSTWWRSGVPTIRVRTPDT